MKNLLIILCVVFFILPLHSQHLSGEIQGTSDEISVTVYKKTLFGYKEAKFSTQKMYLIRLNKRRDNQVWFTDNVGTTKILFIPKNTIQSHLKMNVDFSNTMSALIEGTEDKYILHLIDFDFTVLDCPTNTEGLW